MSHITTIAIRGYHQSDGMPKLVTFEVARAQAVRPHDDFLLTLQHLSALSTRLLLLHSFL